MANVGTYAIFPWICHDEVEFAELNLDFFGVVLWKQVTLERAQWLEDGGLLESDSGSKARADRGGMGFLEGSDGEDGKVDLGG